VLHVLVQANNNVQNIIGDLWWLAAVALCLTRGMG